MVWPALVKLIEGPKKLDSQSIEVLGRNRLIGELMAAGLEVAIPVRDRGIDMIAYVDLARPSHKFAAIPIQMKAASSRVFSLNKKYSRFANLVLTYVWGVQDPEQVQTFALTYAEALRVARAAGWTRTESWARGSYSANNPGKKVRELLEPYKMSRSAWTKKMFEVSRASRDQRI